MRIFSVKHKFSKYKTIFKLSQFPSLLVACVRVCSDTFEKHQSSSVPIFQRNVGNFSTFQFWSLSISVAFLFSVCLQNYVLPLKLKKKRKNFPLSVFREVIHICLSLFVVRVEIPIILNPFVILLFVFCNSFNSYNSVGV